MKTAQLLARIDRASSEKAISTLVLDVAPVVVGADAVGYYGLGDAGTEHLDVRGMTDYEVEYYEEEGRKVDALHKFVVENHVPGRLEMADLERMPDFTAFMKRQGTHVRFRQYMLAPVVLGSVVGMMHFATMEGHPFPEHAMRTATALSMHASARVAVLRAMDSFDASWEDVLSAREREIAQLASRGLSTEQMGRIAGVSPNTIKKHLKSLYEKLEVGSRAELGATLVRGPESISRDRRPAARTPGRRA